MTQNALSESPSLQRSPHQVIRASAGAGKTYRLTVRMVDLLNQGAPPDAILATTFTRKAAGEILGRLLLQLSDASLSQKSCNQLADSLNDLHAGDSTPHNQLTRQRCHDLLGEVCRQLHRMSVMTLDSFFHQLGRAYSFELGVPPGAAVKSDDDLLTTRLRMEAIERVLTDQNIDTLLDLLKRLHHDQAAQSITSALDDIIRGLYNVYREAPHPQRWQAMRLIAQEHLSRELADDELRACIESIPALANIPGLHKGIVNQLPKIHETAAQHNWLKLLTTGLVVKALNEDTYHGKLLDDQILDTLCPLADHALSQIVKLLVDQIESRFDLLKQFDKHFSQLRESHQLLLFSDMPIKLARLLATADESEDLATTLNDIYFRLDGRVHHLLLDEFQDTSLQQWKILQPLAEEITAHAPGSDADRPIGRSFFCVGDVKQAIYGWRGGCAEIFEQLEADLNLPGSAKLSLTTSWRSSQVVLDAVNTVFTNVASKRALDGSGAAADNWDGWFGPHKAEKASLPGHVRLETSPAVANTPTPDAGGPPDEEADSDELNKGHNHYAACSIHEMAQQIRAERPGTSIGVLVPTNALVNEFIYELRTLGSPASGEGGNPVSDDPAVLAVLSALSLSDHPGNQAAAFHVAHSPLGEVVGLDSKTYRTKAIEVAADIRDELARGGYARLIGGWAEAVADCCDTRSRMRLTQLVELGDEFDQAPTLRPRDFVDYATTAVVEEPTPAPIRVMTIHKSKGLEFDVVVLPCLSRTMGRVGQDGYVLRRTPTGPVEAVLPYARSDFRAVMPALAEAHDRQRMQRIAGDLCTLYVAMTRARYGLHMIVPPLKRTKAGLSKAGLCDASFATLVRESLSTMGEAESLDGQVVLHQSGDPHWYRQPAVPDAGEAAELTADGPQVLRFQPRKPTDESRRGLRRVAPSSLESDGAVTARDLLQLRPQAGRSRGSLLHLFFERLAYLPDAFEPADLFPSDQLEALAQRELPDLGPQAIAQGIADFHQMLTQPVTRQALAAPSDAAGVQLWRERSFAVRLDDELLTGIFDRVLVYREAGKPVRAELLDYKTDQVTEANLAQLTAHYRPQIQAYLRALGQMLGLPPKCVHGRLLFVGIDRLINIDSAGA